MNWPCILLSNVNLNYINYIILSFYTIFTQHLWWTSLVRTTYVGKKKMIVFVLKIKGLGWFPSFHVINNYRKEYWKSAENPLIQQKNVQLGRKKLPLLCTVRDKIINIDYLLSSTYKILHTLIICARSLDFFVKKWYSLFFSSTIKNVMKPIVYILIFFCFIRIGNKI